MPLCEFHKFIDAVQINTLFGNFPRVFFYDNISPISKTRSIDTGPKLIESTYG